MDDKELKDLIEETKEKIFVWGGEYYGRVLEILEKFQADALKETK